MQLFWCLAEVETHILWYCWHHCCLVVDFDALGIWYFWMFTLFHAFLLFCTLFSTHFRCVNHFAWLIDMLIQVQGACYRTSYLFPLFSSPLSPWISALGIGCSTPAPMACDLLPWWLGRLKMDSCIWNTTNMGCECSIGNARWSPSVFSVASSHLPPHCPPCPLLNTQSRSSPKAPGFLPLPQEPRRSFSRFFPAEFGFANFKGGSKGHAGGPFGGNVL